jgi:hypothetical protein
MTLPIQPLGHFIKMTLPFHCVHAVSAWLGNEFAKVTVLCGQTLPMTLWMTQPRLVGALPYL